MQPRSLPPEIVVEVMGVARLSAVGFEWFRIPHPVPQTLTSVVYALLVPTQNDLI